MAESSRLGELPADFDFVDEAKWAERAVVAPSCSVCVCGAPLVFLVVVYGTTFCCGERGGHHLFVVLKQPPLFWFCFHLFSLAGYLLPACVTRVVVAPHSARISGRSCSVKLVPVR